MRTHSLSENIDLYRSLGDRLPILCIRKDPRVAELLENRRAALDGLESSVFSEALRSGVVRNLPELSPSDLQECQGRRAPLLKQSGLDVRLEGSLKEILKDLIQEEPSFEILQEGINRAFLTPGNSRWATQTEGDRLIIFGNSQPTLLNLAGFAHELGHYYFEVKTGLENGCFFEILSEATAQTFEELIVDRYIAIYLDQSLLAGLGNSPLRKAWKKYQRNVDSLNRAFSDWERRDLRTGAENAFPFGIDPYFACLRETLFTAIGYQRVYEMASELRLAWHRAH